MNRANRVFFVIALFFCFYFVFGLFNYLYFGSVNNTQDFFFHFSRAQGIDFNPVYPIGFNFFVTFFGLVSYGNPFVFYFVNLVVLVVFIPLLVYFVSKNFWSVLVYFLAVPFVHMAIYGATYAEGFVVFLFVLYLFFRRDFVVLLFLTCIAFFVHGYGLALFGLVWVAEFLGLVVSNRGFFSVGWIAPARVVDFNGLVELVFFQLPLPVLFFSLKKIDVFYFVLLFFSVVFCFFDFRVLSVAQIVCCVLAGQAVSVSKRSIRAGFFVFSFFQCLFYLITYCDGTIKYIVLN